MKKSFMFWINLMLVIVLLGGCVSKNKEVVSIEKTISNNKEVVSSEKPISNNKEVVNSEKPINNKIACYAYSAEPYITLDPSAEYSNGIIVLQNVYETLTRYDYKTQKLKPLIAESWSPSEDGLVWVFKIRKGITFHDGAVLNAEAVKKSIVRTISMNLGAAYNWDSVRSIEVTGEYEVTFNLNYATPLDLIASSGYAAYIISPNATDKDTSWFDAGNDAGSGPYKIKQVTKDEEVLLEKFDDYWGGWKDWQYANVVIKKVVEGSERRQLLENGKAQVSSRFIFSDLKSMKNNENLVVENKLSWSNTIGFMNTEKPPLDNNDFRKALSYAFPYEEVIKNVRAGNAAQSFGLVPPGLWGHNEEISQCMFSLEKAKEHIVKSGIDVKGLKLEMTFTSGVEDYRNFAELYKANLKSLGIDLEVNEMDWDIVWEKATTTNPLDRQDILVMNWWPDYASPMSWFSSLVHTEENPSYNLSYIKNPQLDSMIEDADRLVATDREQAENILVDIQKQVIDKAYFLHIYDDQPAWVIHKSVKGFDTNPAYDSVVFFYDLYTE